MVGLIIYTNCFFALFNTKLSGAMERSKELLNIESDLSFYYIFIIVTGNTFHIYINFKLC